MCLRPLILLYCPARPPPPLAQLLKEEQDALAYLEGVESANLSKKAAKKKAKDDAKKRAALLDRIALNQEGLANQKRIKEQVEEAARVRAREEEIELRKGAELKEGRMLAQRALEQQVSADKQDLRMAQKAVKEAKNEVDKEVAKLRALDVKKEIEIKEWRLQEQRAREQEMYKDTQELMAAQRVVKEAISLDEKVLSWYGWRWERRP